MLRGVISDVLWCPCYALVIMSNRWNQYGFSILHRLYIWGHRWILALLLIFVDWFKSKCILSRIWCIIWRPKRFLIKMSILYNGLYNKFGLYVFPSFIGSEFGIYRLFTVPNLYYAVFAMLWPFQKMLVPRCSTGWSVSKLFFCECIGVKKITGARNPKRSSKFVRGYGVLHSMFRDLM